MALRRACDLIVGATLVDARNKLVQLWVIKDITNRAQKLSRRIALDSGGVVSANLSPTQIVVTLVAAEDPFIAEQRRIVLLVNDLVEVIPEIAMD